MYERDLLVAIIAFVLGLLMISTAWMNYERAFEMRTPQFLSQSLGRSGARLVMGLVGMFIVLMGIYIMCTPFFEKKSLNQPFTDRLIVEEMGNHAVLAGGR